MSFNENHIISLQNYEEWFILYMDDELTPAQKQMVINFLLLHPHLQEEMDLLLSTKLPTEDLVFSGKDDLQAAVMKVNTIEESLLLYVDNELPATEKAVIEQKISTDKDYRLQFELLQRSKLDASEVISYPDKKELYRRVERRIHVPAWMRIAAAISIFLTGGYFFLSAPGNETDLPSGIARNERPATTPDMSRLANNKPVTTPLPQQPVIAKADAEPKAERRAGSSVAVKVVKESPINQSVTFTKLTEAVAIQKVDAVQVNPSRLNTPTTTALNKTLANISVTSASPVAYNQTEGPEESIVTDGDDKQKRTPAKGFLRKVSRFIERRTGIGTVNADNELVVGAVALKLN